MINGPYIKRAIPILAVEANSSDQLHLLAPTLLTWRKTRIDGGEVYNKLHDSWIGFKFGDVLNISNRDDVYPIERAVFEATYVPAAEAA